MPTVHPMYAAYSQQGVVLPLLLHGEGEAMKVTTKQIPPGCKLWDCGYVAWVEPAAPGRPDLPLSAAASEPPATAPGA